jgi:hypothetical protein
VAEIAEGREAALVPDEEVIVENLEAAEVAEVHLEVSPKKREIEGCYSSQILPNTVHLLLQDAKDLMKLTKLQGGRGDSRGGRGEFGSRGAARGGARGGRGAPRGGRGGGAKGGAKTIIVSLINTIDVLIAEMNKRNRTVTLVFLLPAERRTCL